MKRTIKLVVCFLFCLNALLSLFTQLSAQNSLLNVPPSIKIPGFDEPFTSSNLPIVIIDTRGKSIPEAGPRIIADMGIIDNGKYLRNTLKDPINGYLGKIRIEIRGESSASWSKKQYNVETVNPHGENLNVSLLGMPKENDWILNGPFIDKSFMRNVLTFRLSNAMGHYASRTRYCELVLNGEYRGLYILMEKIKRDNNRVDIAKLTHDDNEGDQLTGGYILRIDKMEQYYEHGIHYFRSKYFQHAEFLKKTCYQFRYPKFDEITQQQRDYIVDFINRFEDTMHGNNYADPDSGYSRYINISSFIDGFIISELAKNVDAYRLSSYFYKDKDSNGGKLNMGPLWDFNLAYGMANYYDCEDTDGWTVDTLSSPKTMPKNDQLAQFWWIKLFREENFAAKMQARWWELRKMNLKEESILNFIDSTADTLQEALERNFAIWSPPGEPGEGFWPVPKVVRDFTCYQDEVDYLKDWLSLRIAWMDENFPLITSVEEISSLEKTASDYALGQNYPNPFNPVTTIPYQLSKWANVKLEIINLAGQTVTILLAGRQPAGSYTAAWNGRSNYGQTVTSGVYMSRLTIDSPEGSKILVKKMLLIK